MGLGGIGWDRIGLDGIGWDRMGSDWMGWDRMGLGWIGWTGLGGIGEEAETREKEKEVPPERDRENRKEIGA